MADSNPDSFPSSNLIPANEDWRLKNDDTDFDKWIRCGICNGKLRDPRTLACLHTFCLECIEFDYNMQRRTYDAMVCPSLQEEFVKHQGCFMCVICHYPLYMPYNNARRLPSNYNFLKVSYNARAEWVDQFPSSAYVGSPRRGEINRLSNASDVASSVSPGTGSVGYQEATQIAAQKTPVSRSSSNAEKNVTEAKEDTPLIQSSLSGYGGLSPRSAETTDIAVQDKNVTSALPHSGEPQLPSSSTEHEKLLSVPTVEFLPREVKSPKSGETSLPTKSAMDQRKELAEQHGVNRKLDLVEAVKTSLPASPVTSEKSDAVEESTNLEKTVAGIEPKTPETGNDGGCAVIGASSHSPGHDELLIREELEEGSGSPHTKESRNENVSGPLCAKEDDSKNSRSPIPVVKIDESASSAEKCVPIPIIDDSLVDSCATKSSLGQNLIDAASGAEGSPSHCKETGASPQKLEPRAFTEASPGSEASEASDGSLDCATRGVRSTAKAVRETSYKEAVDVAKAACTADNVIKQIAQTPRSSRSEITSSSEDNYSTGCENTGHEYTSSNKETDSLSGTDDKETETFIHEELASVSSKDYESFSSEQTDTSSTKEDLTFSNEKIEGSPFQETGATDKELGASTDEVDCKFSDLETEHSPNKENETPFTKETGKSPVREAERSSSSDETRTSSTAESSSSSEIETSSARDSDKSPIKKTEPSPTTGAGRSPTIESKVLTTNDAEGSPIKETEQFSKESGAMMKQTMASSDKLSSTSSCNEACQSSGTENNTLVAEGPVSDHKVSASNLCEISCVKESNSVHDQHNVMSERANFEPNCDRPLQTEKKDDDKTPESNETLPVMPGGNDSASPTVAEKETTNSSHTGELLTSDSEQSSGSPKRKVQKLEIPPTKLPKASRWPAASSVDRLQQHYNYVKTEAELLGAPMPPCYDKESKEKKKLEKQRLKRAVLFLDMKYEFQDPAPLYVTSLAVNRRTGNFVVIDNSLNLAIMYRKMADEITYDCIGLHHFREPILDCEFLNDDREQILVMARTFKSCVSEGGILMYKLAFGPNTPRRVLEKIPFYSNPSLRDAGGFVTTTGPDRFLFTLPDSNCIGETVGPSVVEVKRNCGTFKLPSHIARFQWGEENYYAISDTGNHQVVILDSSFKRCFVVGKFGSEDGEFFYPHGLTVDDDKMLYVCDANNYRVQQFRLKATHADFKGCPVRYTYQLKNVSKDMKPVDCGITRTQQLLLVLFRCNGHGVLQLYHLQETEDRPEIVLKSFRANDVPLERRLREEALRQPIREQEDEGSCWRCCLLPCCPCACRRKRNARDRRAYEQIP